METETKQKINTCDHGHQGQFEVRVLPLSNRPCHGNVILCQRHFVAELAFREVSNLKLAEENKFDLPTWESLKVYDPS